MPFGGSKIQIIETPNQIKAKIIFEVREEVNRRFRAKYSIVNTKIGAIIGEAVRSSPASTSLLSGQLRVDFGLYNNDAEGVIQEIINIVKQSTFVYLNKGGSGLVFSLTIKVDPSKFTRELSKIGYTSYAANGSTHEVPWMKWLLTMGTTVIIDDYNVMYKNGKGRSGGGLMIKNNAEGFRVDPSFAGTSDDNFITKAIEEAFPRIILTLQEFL